jgi:hypothetical protein
MLTSTSVPVAFDDVGDGETHPPVPARLAPTRPVAGDRSS